MSENATTALRAALIEAHQRTATVHERVRCPKCRAPEGELCRAMPVGYVIHGRSGRRLSHSHSERLRADGIPWR